MKSRKNWVPLWAVPLLILMAIGTVWLRLSIVRTTYGIDQADRKIRELQLAREQTELRTMALRSPRRLEILAKTRFGLAQPKAEQIVHLRDVVGAEHAP